MSAHQMGDFRCTGCGEPWPCAGSLADHIENESTDRVRAFVEANHDGYQHGFIKAISWAGHRVELTAEDLLILADGCDRLVAAAEERGRQEGREQLAAIAEEADYFLDCFIEGGYIEEVDEPHLERLHALLAALREVPSTETESEPGDE